MAGMARVRISRAQRRAADHYARLRVDEYTGLYCCWVCNRPMDPVLYDHGFASHPDCDPGEISDKIAPEKEPAWLRMVT